MADDDHNVCSSIESCNVFGETADEPYFTQFAFTESETKWIAVIKATDGTGKKIHHANFAIPMVFVVCPPESFWRAQAHHIHVST